MGDRGEAMIRAFSESEILEVERFLVTFKSKTW